GQAARRARAGGAATRHRGAARPQSGRPAGTGPPGTQRRHGLFRNRFGNVRRPRAGDGGPSDDSAGAARDRATSCGRAGAGAVGVARLRGLRSTRVPPRAAGVLPARAAVGRCPGARRGHARRRVERIIPMRRMAAAVAAVALAGATPLAAQYFGQNKVQYRNFAFQIIQTEHFEVYYYSAERVAALDAARMAERWYARLSHVLHHEFQGRKPIILYASQSDFQQTNVVDASGEGLGGVTEFFKHRMVLPFTG